MKLIPHSKEAVDRFFLHVQPSIIAAPSCKTFGRQLLSHDRIFTIPIGNYTQLLGRAGIRRRYSIKTFISKVVLEMVYTRSSPLRTHWG